MISAQDLKRKNNRRKTRRDIKYLRRALFFIHLADLHHKEEVYLHNIPLETISFVEQRLNAAGFNAVCETDGVLSINWKTENKP